MILGLRASVIGCWGWDLKHGEHRLWRGLNVTGRLSSKCQPDKIQYPFKPPLSPGRMFFLFLVGAFILPDAVINVFSLYAQRGHCCLITHLFGHKAITSAEPLSPFKHLWFVNVSRYTVWHFPNLLICGKSRCYVTLLQTPWKLIIMLKLESVMEFDVWNCILLLLLCFISPFFK